MWGVTPKPPNDPQRHHPPEPTPTRPAKTSPTQADAYTIPNGITPTQRTRRDLVPLPDDRVRTSRSRRAIKRAVRTYAPSPPTRHSLPGPRNDSTRLTDDSANVCGHSNNNTIDYGPYGWIDNYDPDWTPNTTDAAHRRYRFGSQLYCSS